MNHDERRQFERYPVNLDADIMFRSDDGESFRESCHLRDISGGGLSFITRHGEWYQAGQHINVIIHLPGEEALQAKVKRAGTVMWVGGSSDGETSVGVLLDDLMVFSQSMDDVEL